MRVAKLAGVIAALILAAGCSRSKTERQDPNDPAVKAYGYGPVPNQHVRYQPDVVFIGDGPHAIRAVSDDEVTWTIDAGAKGADQLAVGKIMFATSRAVGRVMSIERRGKNVAVTLGPVAFTEVVRDAVIDLNTTLDAKLLASEQSPPGRLVPELPVLPEQGATFRTAEWRPDTAGAHLTRIGDGPADVNKSSLKLKYKNFEIEPYWKLKGELGVPITAGTDDASILNEYRSKNPPPEYDEQAHDPNVLVKKEEARQTEFGFKFLYSPLSGGGDKPDENGNKPGWDQPGAPKYGLKLGFGIRLSGQNVRIRSHLAVADGKVNGPVTFVVDGIDRMHLGFLGGAENGFGDNVKGRVEVPWDMAIPVPIDGIPTAIHLKFKFLVETAFSGGNSTMWAGGDYQLIGSVGIDKGMVMTPTVAVVTPMSDNMHGLTAGVSGVIIAAEFRFLLGLGNRAFIAGGYSKTIITLATVKGSYLGFYLAGPLSNPLGGVGAMAAKCHGIKLKGDTGGGIGVYIDKDVATGFIAKLTEVEMLENMGTFFDKEYRVGCPTADH